MIYSIILISFAAALDAVQDILKSKFDVSVFKNLGTWWDPSKSWVNKWAVNSTTKERFFGSSTFLVFLTDAWHFFKMLMLGCLFAAFLFPVSFYIILLFPIIWGVIFELFYKILKNQ